MTKDSETSVRIEERTAMDTISIATEEGPLLQGPGGHNAFPTLREVTSKASTVAFDGFKEHLSKIVEQLQHALDSAGDEQSRYAIAEAQFNLTVNAEGEISILGKASAGVTAGITVTLRQKSQREK